VPVVIIYLTAMLEPVSDDVRFMKDVYDRDQPLLDALNGEVLIDLPASAD
jgi:murein L,D-transpeptidase YcbB/YkuD